MTGTAPKRDHAGLWRAIHDCIAPVCKAVGFAPHPAFPAQFDRADQAYECAFIGPLRPDGLRLINLSYSPQDGIWHIIGHLYLCTDGKARMTRLGGSAADWTADLQSLPRRRSDLIPSEGWRIWRRASRRIEFDEKTGKPKDMTFALGSVLRGWPDFIDSLTRPGLPPTHRPAPPVAQRH